MTPFADAIAALRRNRAELPLALEREVAVAMEAAAKLAQSFIGEEMPGWTPLAEATLADKARKGYATPKPLLRTGELRDSIKGQAEPIPGGVRGVVGTNDEHAATHETGSFYEPPRPFLAPALILTEPVLASSLAALAVRTLTPGARP